MSTQPIDVYQTVTDRIISQLEQHVIPWRKPWTQAGPPQNLVTKRYYTGINSWLLASLGYAQNYFLTFNQIQELGARVKAGEKAHIAAYFKRLETIESYEREGTMLTKRLLLRYYYVFNIAQCDGLPEILDTPLPQHSVSLINGCEEIIERMPNCPPIKHNKQAAFYDADKDCINMPKQASFSSLNAYYSTLFHELVHSTGHASRLGRIGITASTTKDSPAYCTEELIAEIGACYLSSLVGIEDGEFDNSVAYINHWLEALRNDKRLILFASGQAQKAIDFILNGWQKPQEGEMQVLETEAR